MSVVRSQLFPLVPGDVLLILGLNASRGFLDRLHALGHFHYFADLVQESLPLDTVHTEAFVYAPLLLLQNVVLDLVVHGLVGVRARLLGSKAGPLLLRKPNALRRLVDLVLDAAEELVINHFVQVNHAFHAALCLRFLRLFSLYWQLCLHQVLVHLLLLLELLFEGANVLLLLFLGLVGLDEVDTADESIF